MPPASRNHLVPTAGDIPASIAASSLAMPAAIAPQNLSRSSRPAVGGRPGDHNGGRPDRSERRFRVYMWRAVDHEGEVLDMLVQRPRQARCPPAAAQTAQKTGVRAKITDDRQAGLLRSRVSASSPELPSSAGNTGEQPRRELASSG